MKKELIFLLIFIVIILVGGFLIYSNLFQLTRQEPPTLEPQPREELTIATPTNEVPSVENPEFEANLEEEISGFEEELQSLDTLLEEESSLDQIESDLKNF